MLGNAPIIPTKAAGPCSVCGGAWGRTVSRGQDFEYETCSNVWVMKACERCSHVQLDPLPAVGTLGIIYPKNYYSYDMRGSVNALALRCKSWLDKRKFSAIVKLFGRMPESYVDVGCGDGRYLKHMMNQGLNFHRVVGMEIDEDAVRRGQEKGVNVVRASAEQADLAVADTSVDLITMFHVIEHVERPDHVVRDLVKKLRPGGMLVLETPCFDSLDARLFQGRFWGGYHFPRHWHIFTTHSITTLLGKSGLIVEAIRYQPGHSFWLFSLHHALKFGHGRPGLARFFHPLKNIAALAVVVAFDLVRAMLGQKTSAMLVAARKPTVQQCIEPAQ